MVAAVEARVTVPISKVDDERRQFGGWAYVAKDEQGQVVVDHSGDFVDTPEAWDALVTAATNYAVEVRAGDDMHRNFEVAKLAEFFVLDEAKREATGITGGPEQAIFMSFRADQTPEGEALWQEVKKGNRRALSIVGRGAREDAAPTD